MNTSNLKIILHQIFVLADKASTSSNAIIIYLALSHKKNAIEIVDRIFLAKHARDKARFGFAKRKYDQSIKIYMNTLNQIANDLLEIER